MQNDTVNGWGFRRRWRRNGGGLSENDWDFAAKRHWAPAHSTPAPRFAIRCIACTSHCRVRLPMERPFGTQLSRQTPGFDASGLGEAAHRQPCTGVQGVSGSQGYQPLARGTACAMGRGARHVCDKARNTPAAKYHKRTASATHHSEWQSHSEPPTFANKKKD